MSGWCFQPLRPKHDEGWEWLNGYGKVHVAYVHSCTFFTHKFMNSPFCRQLASYVKTAQTKNSKQTAKLYRTASKLPGGSSNTTNKCRAKQALKLTAKFLACFNTTTDRRDPTHVHHFAHVLPSIPHDLVQQPQVVGRSRQQLERAAYLLLHPFPPVHDVIVG